MIALIVKVTDFPIRGEIGVNAQRIFLNVRPFPVVRFIIILFGVESGQEIQNPSLLPVCSAGRVDPFFTIKNQFPLQILMIIEFDQLLFNPSSIDGRILPVGIAGVEGLP